MTHVDLVIPVYNEGDGIIAVLESFRTHVKTPFRVLICYDMDNDTTLDALDQYEHKNTVNIVRVKNPGRGPHSAIMAGINASDAPAVFSYMGDDDFNAPLIDPMVAMFNDGYDIVTGSRFMKGGCMTGCVWYKKLLTQTASFTMHHIGRLPLHDATNGIRLFSRRLVDSIEIESSKGFTFTFEMLVKAHRLKLRVGEIPAQWHERKVGTSNFRILEWIRPYLRWYFFVFATTWLRRGPHTVRLRENAPLADPNSAPHPAHVV